MGTAVDFPSDVDLTEKQRLFAREYVVSGDRERAMLATGYTGINGSTLAARMLAHPKIRAAIEGAVSHLLVTEGAPLGYRVLKELAGKAESGRVRADCAKALIDRGGHAVRNQPTAEGDEKPLNEMTADELRATIEKLEGELANRATPVEAAQNAPTDSLADMLG